MGADYMQRVNFTKLVASGFKNHESLTVDFGDVTKISGRNGIGKSSIAEMITWTLFGVDTFGSTKFDPTPINADLEPHVSLFIKRTTEEGQAFETKLEKQLVKGKAKYIVNDVPQKATEYDAIISSLFDKNYFLSIFNPGYFFTQHWKEQREQLLQFVAEPLNSEVLDKLNENHVKALEEPLKKHTIEELEKINAPLFKTKDTEIERAGERVVTLQEQLEHAKSQAGDKDSAQEALNAIEAKLKDAQAINDKAKASQKEKAAKDYKLDQLNNDINRLKDRIISMQEQEIANDCPKCGQDLGEDSKKRAEDNHAKEIKDLKAKGSQFVAERKKLKQELAEMVLNEETVDTASLQEQRYEHQRVLEAYKNVERLEENVVEAQKKQKGIRKERNNAQAILQATKEFHTSKSELMVEKVQSLFERLTVKLFDHKKNGSITPTFEIEYEGKPYNKLSTAEKIKAGLELVEALIGQAEMSVPVFIDNAESIITFKQPSAQLITASVKNSNLTIKGDE
jgi:hypothetical protein